MVSESFVIDLYHLYAVHLDEDTKKVTVGGGAFVQDVDRVLEPHKLAITLGIKPDVGIGGLVLSGGYGFLARNYGLAVDQLVEAEVVLADGTIVVANDENEYADLIWALRGGGGNFGVVSKFVFQAFKLPTYCYGGTVSYYAPTFASAKSICLGFDNIIQVFFTSAVTAVN
jgi:FAD/FMN-containing dehydrogenase